MKQIHENIFIEWKGKKKLLLTKNLTPGKSFFKDDYFNYNYRIWNPKRSKLAAAILKNIKLLPIKKNSKILYLGAANGYTCSFISDIAENGYIFCIDFAIRSTIDLVFLCEQRKNLTPLLEDANKPENYKNKISKVNLIYQDIAQRNQVQIFLKNIDTFLNKKDFALLALKARSIDVTKKPQTIFNEVKKQLEKKLRIIDFKFLDPLQKDHCFYVCQVK